MKGITSSKTLAVAALAALPQLATGHSWVEQSMRIAPNGTMIGTPGYERAHFVRGASGEGDVVWMIPPDGRSDGKVIRPDDKIARPGQQSLSASSYQGKFQKLKAAPGDFVALQYQENGHVTLPLINPKKTLNGGTIYVYGTTQSDLTKTNLVDVHLSWTADGTGGDQKGKLIATRNYDDGQCYQVNGNSVSTQRQQAFSKKAQDPMGADLWCQTDVQLPSDVQAGDVYTLIWVWDWPTMNVAGVPVPPASFYANNSKSDAPFVTEPQIYTSVIDIDIVNACDDSLGDVKGPGCHASGNSTAKNVLKFVKQANLNVGGSKSQLQNPFQVAVPQADSSIKFASEALTNIPLYTMFPESFANVQTAAPVVSAPSGAATTKSKPAPAATTGASSPNNGVSVVTVTQTVPAKTVFVTQTVTAGAAATVASGKSPKATKATQTTVDTAAGVTPSPFMRSRKVRRGAGQWQFGQI